MKPRVLMGHKTSAWPLSLVYVVLVVYASLYPFSDWRNQGGFPLGFMLAPWPHYWTAFDLLSNVLGYAPLGFFLALALLRSGRPHHAVAWATLMASLLSLLMEVTQSYLPARVPSNIDWATNSAGAWMGAAASALLERWGVLARWVRFRARWFVEDSRGAIVLLSLWPFALLFPAALPLGLGQVLERLQNLLEARLADTPIQSWLPLHAADLQPLAPWAEVLCVALGLLIPCLLGFSVITSLRRRALFIVWVGAMALGASFLSAALSYGPTHAAAWLSPRVQVALVLAGIGALLLITRSPRICVALLLLGLGVFLGLINLAPASPYFAHNLQIWEQGRFIRFNGLAQWLGWLWPYVVLIYVLERMTEDGDNAPGGKAPKIRR